MAYSLYNVGMDNIKHGTLTAYVKHKCRCEECREAQSVYWKKRSAVLRDRYPDWAKIQSERVRHWRAENPEWAKELSRRTAKQWRENHPEWKTKENLRRYGLTIGARDQMIADQSGVCAICQRPNQQRRGDTDGKLHVDHCHETGAIRGMLCHNCNLGLGCFKDDAERLKKAIEYLEKDNAQ